MQDTFELCLGHPATRAAPERRSTVKASVSR
jgi:hypothetical protein